MRRKESMGANMIRKFRRIVQAGVVAGMLTGATLAFPGLAQALPVNCQSLQRQSDFLWNSAFYENGQYAYWNNQGDYALAAAYRSEAVKDAAAASRVDRQMAGVCN
jgi:hypothetical protein